MILSIRNPRNQKEHFRISIGVQSIALLYMNMSLCFCPFNKIFTSFKMRIFRIYLYFQLNISLKLYPTFLAQLPSYFHEITKNNKCNRTITKMKWKISNRFPFLLLIFFDVNTNYIYFRVPIEWNIKLNNGVPLSKLISKNRKDENGSGPFMRTWLYFWFSIIHALMIIFILKASHATYFWYHTASQASQKWIQIITTIIKHLIVSHVGRL